MAQTGKGFNFGERTLLVFFACAFAVLFFNGLYSFYNGECEIRAISKRCEAAKIRVEKLQRERADLLAERRRLHDNRYIEKLARENHNMVGKNEIPLFIVK